jgi:NitT/TauT family transport system substrate-binding protein
MRSLQSTALSLLAILLAACSGDSDTTRLRVQLNWAAEPEFGGFYAAMEEGLFTEAKQEVQLIGGGLTTPSAQMCARGDVEFAIVSAEQVLTFAEQGADLVALFATFQHSPFVLVVREDSPWKSLEELWKSNARAAVEPGLPWIAELDRKLGGHTLTLVPYTMQLAPFTTRAVDAIQGFISSEPVQLRLQGLAVRCFSLGESGYDPYAQVLVTSRKFLDQNQATVTAFVNAARRGWASYNAHAPRFNPAISKLNPAMDCKAMDIAAEIQLAIVQPAGLADDALGTMTLERWQTLAQQMHTSSKLKRMPTDLERRFVNLR